MSNDHNGGSDLDIFEGLGKKASDRVPVAPPPPPNSAPARPPLVQVDAKRTLLGIPGPAVGGGATPVNVPSVRPAPEAPRSVPPPLPGSAEAAARSAAPPSSRPNALGVPRGGSRPPPPGRGTLPTIVKTSEGSLGTSRANTARTPLVPPAATTGRPPPASVRPATGPTATAKPNGRDLTMDWDDEDEATHVFVERDKDKGDEPTRVYPEKPSVEELPPTKVNAILPAAAGAADESTETLAISADKEPERASMDTIMSSPPPPRVSVVPATPHGPPAVIAAPPTDPDPASMSGAFGQLGQPRDNKSNGIASSASAASSRLGSVVPTPPPPASQKIGGPTTQPMPPPPPPPGQVTTAPMHMPPASVPPVANQPAMGKTMPSATHPPTPQMGSVPPPAHTQPVAAVPQRPSHPATLASAMVAPSVPPPASQLQVARAMEATHVVPREGSKTPLILGLLVAVMGIAGGAAFFLMPRSGTLVVNVADSKGAAVPSLEVVVDGTTRCPSAPCILRDFPAGVHEVKVVAKGFEPPAPRAVTVESRHDTTSDFQLVASKSAAGTGFKVAAPGPGVKLSIDGKDIGPLPQELRDLEPGDHKLRFSGDRFAPLEKTVSVAKDEIVDLGSIALKVTKGKATIQLGTPGAKVYLVSGTTRKEVPQFPMAIEFDPSEKWELQGTKDGFDDFRETIAFEDGQAEKTYNVTLAAKGAKSAVAAPVVAAPVAAAPAVAAAPKEPAAPVAKAAAPVVAAPAKEQAPSSDATAATKKTAAASEATGETTLKINSLPASSIVLDGKPIGVTPQLHVAVTPGSHTIMFVNAEQSLKKTITVEVKAGETKAAFAKLRE